VPQLQDPDNAMNKCEIIRRYILAMKGVDIGGIAEPTTPEQWMLFDRAYQVAMFWYYTSR